VEKGVPAHERHGNPALTAHSDALDLENGVFQQPADLDSIQGAWEVNRCGVRGKAPRSSCDIPWTALAL